MSGRRIAALRALTFVALLTVASCWSSKGQTAQSKTVSAVIRGLEGSDLVVRENVPLTVRFDDSLRLASIGAQVGLTVP